jgi:hypothetical protein
MNATIIKAEAGSGKTFHTAEAIAQYPGRVEVYVATHKLACEWEALVRANNPSKRVRVIRGRNHLDDGGVPMCQLAWLAETLSVAGQPVFPNLCRQSGSSGTVPVFCQHYNNCAYIQQFSDFDDVLIYVHDYLGLERTALENRLPAFVVIDESFWSKCIATFDIPLSLLRSPLLPPCARTICNDLATAFECGMPEVRNMIRKAAQNDQWVKVIDALAKPNAIARPDSQPDVIERAIATALPTGRIAMMLKQLRIETQFERPIQSVQYDCRTQTITVHYRKPITRFSDPDPRHAARTTRFLLLDASADIPIIQRFFEVDAFAEIQTERNAVVTQCKSTRCSTSYLNPDTPDNDAIAAIDELVNRLAATGDVLMVGPAKITGNPSKSLPSLLTGGANVHLAHFGAVRGIDEWKNIDTVVIIGRNQPPITAIEDFARALYFDDPQPLILNAELIDQDRGYSMRDGTLIGVPVQVHPDTRIQAIMEQIRERESEQALDRLRLVHHVGRPKQVILLSNLPLNITVDRLASWQDMTAKGSRLDQAWGRQTVGVMPLEKTWLAKSHPDLWPSVGAAGKEISRKKGHFPISTIGKMSLSILEYRFINQRRWSKCLAAQNDLVFAQEALQKLLGAEVICRLPKAA